MSDLIGKTVGQYQIVEQIGKGGMATIFKAYQPSIDRYVAVKILPRQFADDPTFVKRFQQEAKAIAALEHPHILPVHDFGTEGDLNYMVMRYVKGGTLADIMGMEVPLNKTTDYVASIAKALDYAHKNGVVHRDIKPSNVLIDEHGEALLTDFGIAKIVEGAQATQLTASGSVLGTPAYMSPEQAQNEKIDGRSDIYSLGVVLYELLTGQQPYQGETPFAVVIKHISEPLPPPRQVNPNIPEPFEMVVLKAMAKEPGERYQVAGEMAKALQNALQQGGATMAMPAGKSTPTDTDRLATPEAKTTPDAPAVAAPPPAAIPAKKSKAPLVVGGIVVLILLCIGMGILGLLIAGLSDTDDTAQQVGSSNVQLGDDGSTTEQVENSQGNQDNDTPAGSEAELDVDVPEDGEGELDEDIPEGEEEELTLDTPEDEDNPEEDFEESDFDIPEEDILFFDDFSSTRNGWYTSYDEDEYGEYEAQIEEGVYRVYLNAISEDGNFGWVEPDFVDLDDFVLSVEVPAVEYSGSIGYGVVFRSTPEGAAYFFEIDDYGFWVVYIPEEDDWVELVEYTEAPAINPNGPNLLEVEAFGPELAFFINGEEVAYLEDDAIESGSVGVITELFGADSELSVDFDNFVVFVP